MASVFLLIIVLGVDSYLKKINFSMSESQAIPQKNRSIPDVFVLLENGFLIQFCRIQNLVFSFLFIKKNLLDLLSDSWVSHTMESNPGIWVYLNP